MNTKNSVPTDSPQKIIVESQLVYVLWSQGRAYAGFEAEFEVKTLLVGDGAKVKANCFTEKGKKLGKVEGVMVLNRFRGKMLIPETVKPDDYVYLEVEVVKIGIKGESNTIPVRPPLQAKSIKWSKKEAKRDEEVKLTCEFTNGIEEGDAVSVIIYEYDRDGYHDKVITIPTTIKNNRVEVNWKFLYQDETDEIPTEDELKKYGKHYNPPEYFFVVMVDNIPVGRKQESGLLRFLDSIEFFVRNHKNVAVADKTYTVTFADGKKKDGKLDGRGYVKLTDVPAGPFFLEVEGMPPLKAERGGGASAGAASDGAEDVANVKKKEGVNEKKDGESAGALSGSVGKGGKNNSEDVQKVKKRLNDLGYPVTKIDGTIDDETIKAIKLFQIAYQVIETGEDTSNPVAISFPDGLISKGKKTEGNLFSDSPKKYECPLKGEEKPISADCKEKIGSATGANKTVWERIVKVWTNISPYLPAGSSMTSGYRSADEQKTLLYNFYNVKYKDRIIKKNSKADWQKYYDLEGTNNTDADAKILQMVRACGQKIAAPGSSPHQKGIAIDIGGTGDQKQCRVLLWCLVMRPGGAEITKILPEVNGCVHFEFKPNGVV